MTGPTPYALLDVGGGARLERFGERVVDRPAPGALGDRREPAAWRRADLRFDRDGGWSGPAADAPSWSVEVAGVTLELRPTDAGQVGLFPEHVATVPWLLAQGAATMLSLFAYTGLATLAAAGAGTAVTHVDASRPAVAWARHNAERSGLADRPIRWIVDDARGFVAREARRGRSYAAIVLDPPTYGHGPGGRSWSMADLPALLADCRVILEPGGAVLLTAHTPDHDEDRLAAMLAAGVGVPAGRIGIGRLSIATEDGRVLDLGAFARVAATADRAS
jgi:23S rRNA (cytosine1962-C5)-methyltransferase